jgi:hypothetical protein
VWGIIEGITDFPTPTISYSNIMGGRTTLPNKSADPQFVDPANDDYQLDTGSPSIDAGSDALVPSGITTDLTGIDDSRFNGTVDMGAYEYYPIP